MLRARTAACALLALFLVAPVSIRGVSWNGNKPCKGLAHNPVVQVHPSDCPRT